MEHLETDVMRFMAILAFCLVAIFALVQSLPLNREPVAVQVSAPPVATEPTDDRAVALPAPATASSRPYEPVTAARHPTRNAPPAAASPPDDQRAEQPQQSLPAQPATPDPPRPAAAAQNRGFSLRFASDDALTALIARDEVDLFAFSGHSVWQLMLVDGQMTFRSAQAPARFHEMTPQTVPRAIATTLRRVFSVPGTPLRWGVTLPASTEAALTRIIATNGGGSLIIDADGFLRLEAS